MNSALVDEELPAAQGLELERSKEPSITWSSCGRRPSSAGTGVLRRRHVNPQDESCIPDVNLNKVGCYVSNPRWTIKGNKSPDRRSHLTPGPGHYGTIAVDTYWTRRAPKCSFKGPSKKCWIAPAPGPSDYEDVDLSGKGPKLTMGKRFIRAPRPVTPGPGAYNTRRGLAGQHRTMSMPSLRPRGLQTPGPGAYDQSNPNELAGPRHVIGTSERDKLWASDTPGPCEYTPGSYTMTRKPKYTVRERNDLKSDAVAQTLGPTCTQFAH